MKLNLFKGKKKKREEFLKKEFEEGNVIRIQNSKRTYNFSNKFAERNKL